MRIAVIGAGGVGGYLGARLAAGGGDVAFLARGSHLRAMREHGLRVDSIHGDLHLDEVVASDDAREIGPCDVVLMCVKSPATVLAAREHLPALVTDGTAVISLQNGLGNLESIAEVVGWQHVVGGVVLIFSTISAPGRIDHTGGPARVLVGELDGSRSERVDAFADRCQAAGLDATAVADIRAAMWDKLAFICAQAGTTAAVRLPLGEIRSSPRSWALFRQLVEEAYAVARAAGVAVADDAVEQRLAFAGTLEAGSYSSLHHDLVTGAPMELDALHGAVVRLAAEHDVPVPMSEAVLAVLEPWAARNADGAPAPPTE